MTSRQPPPPAPPAAVDHGPEMKVTGVRACLAVFEKRPADIIRVYVSPDRVKVVGNILAWCASQRRAYHVVEAAELDRVAEGTHHEGVCMLVRRPAAAGIEDLLREAGTPTAPATIVALENVGNPHNVGAILRVCAHFGVRWVLALGDTPHRASSALARTAEGGAEHAQLVHVEDITGTLRSLRQRGYVVVATSHRGSTELHATTLPPRAVWLFGAEGAGLTPALMGAADMTVRIGGSGWVESLNVACATSTVLGETWRQQRVAAPTRAEPVRSATPPPRHQPHPPRGKPRRQGGKRR